jgi:hypothetical protein
MDGKIEIDPMITHTMSLADINKGFDLMHEGKSITSVVVYGPAIGARQSEPLAAQPPARRHGGRIGASRRTTKWVSRRCACLLGDEPRW